MLGDREPADPCGIRVTFVSLHSAWPSTDPFLGVVVEGWQVMAHALGRVTDMVIKGDLPVVLHTRATQTVPNTSARSQSSYATARGQRVDAFVRQSEADLTHHARAAVAPRVDRSMPAAGHDQAVHQ